MENKLTGAGIGSGYFSGFQYEAWKRIPEVQIAALSSLDPAQSKPLQEAYAIARHYTDYRQMLDQEQPDFVDIITPPATHLDMVSEAAERGIHVICQKPLAPTMDEARKIVDLTARAGVRFMVHENFRFQPWYRKIKALLEDRAIGRVHYVYFRSRMGDGWGEKAYIPRQPYFREYPRLLVYENGIHFIDTFRFLFGEVSQVFARLKKLNPVIRGEDFALIHFEFESGITGIWDANRYNAPNYDKPRYTFGEMLLEGQEGSIRLYGDGRIGLQPLGEAERDIPYEHRDINFSGDCVYHTQLHFVDSLLNKRPFETNGPDYLKSLAVQEAVYRSAEAGTPIPVDSR